MFRKNNLAFEAIDFQSNQFGKKLESLFQELIDLKFDQAAIYRAKLHDRIAKAIKEETNITARVHFPIADVNEIYAVVRSVSINHIFGNFQFRQNSDELEGFAYSFDKLKHVVEAYKKQDMKARVDMREGKVYGAFAEHAQDIVFSLLHMKKYALTPKQMTAVCLHELGHIFTYFEYMCRMRTTNLALEALAISSSASQTNREYFYTFVANGFGLDKDTMRDLSVSKDNMAAATFVLTECFRKADSSLGAREYDQTGSEYVADVYAARYGYGRDLVVALTKVNNKGNSSLMVAIIHNVKEMLKLTAASTFLVMAVTGQISILALLTGLALAIVTRGFFYLSTERAYVYDDDRTRYSRIKEQLIAYLKTKPEDKQSVLKAIEDIEEIEKIISQTKDAVPLIVKIKEAIFKSKRDLRKYIALQRDLEKLGYNDLFKSAAKLDALAS